jgi:hypothetical protein
MGVLQMTQRVEFVPWLLVVIIGVMVIMQAQSR